ncbi:hypothetical protein OIY81_2783 [Cryptosporidium canis]|uniref:Proteasome activator Blm10 middle HEAT repeats region domain-containing protein n=1 Tax=Cryptosporidium canis TaxID=195482 RepID=A0ABQ8PA99_9CRYT|nr:hypothetical protein OIY81_2783 [Cryptosporidium canis]KAJ1614356.1 hypothetical protein OJ252_657 [Cryptosporidium canis]
MFEKTVDFKDYFPGFVDEGVKRRETREAVEEILVLLSDDELFSVRMVQKLTRLIRQLNQFEDAVFIRFVGRGERVRIIQSVWDVVQNKQVTMSTRVRFANILASHLSSYKKLYLRPWWHGGFVSQVDLEAGPASPEFRCGCGEGFAEERPGARDENCLCGLIGLSQIVRLIEDEFTRGYLEGLTTNHQKVKNYVSSLARVLNAYRPYVREEELDEFVRRWLSLSTSSYSFFVYSKLFVLACSPYYSFRLVESGRIFEIWEVLNGQFVSHWDSAMVTVISRGVRYSWRVGRSLDCLYQKIPYLFQVLYINLGIPILHNLVSNSVNTGATCSNSSVSSGAASSQVLQTKAPSVIKEIISNELLSALTVKPVNLFNKFAIVFTHLLKSLRHLQSPESLETAERVKAIPDSLVNLVSIIYPLNHPSNIGKWSHGISIFVQALTYQFCKRIYRERVLCRSEAIAPAQRESVLQASLCRFDDEYLMSILFPLIEQGIYSKDVQVAGRYEDALKRWTYILPDVLLSFLLNVKIMPALEGDTETHQVYIAFRILTTVVPIVIHFTPQELPKFLQISLQGIDISDPMKINQTLFFLTVLFYNLQNFQVESLDFDEYEAVEELSSSLQSGGEAGLLRSYYTLYNYPTHSIPISDRSLRSRKDLPREILDQTDIGGQFRGRGGRGGQEGLLLCAVRQVRPRDLAEQVPAEKTPAGFHLWVLDHGLPGAGLEPLGECGEALRGRELLLLCRSWHFLRPEGPGHQRVFKVQAVWVQAAPEGLLRDDWRLGLQELHSRQLQASVQDPFCNGGLRPGALLRDGLVQAAAQDQGGVRVLQAGFGGELLAAGLGRSQVPSGPARFGVRGRVVHPVLRQLDLQPDQVHQGPPAEQGQQGLLFRRLLSGSWASSGPQEEDQAGGDQAPAEIHRVPGPYPDPGAAASAPGSYCPEPGVHLQGRPALGPAILPPGGGRLLSGPGARLVRAPAGVSARGEITDRLQPLAHPEAPGETRPSGLGALGPPGRLLPRLPAASGGVYPRRWLRGRSVPGPRGELQSPARAGPYS